MTVTDKDAKQLQKMFEKLEKQNKKEWDILKKHPNLAKQPYSCLLYTSPSPRDH